LLLLLHAGEMVSPGLVYSVAILWIHLVETLALIILLGLHVSDRGFTRGLRTRYIGARLR
jgi:hypothetical protein